MSESSALGKKALRLPDHNPALARDWAYQGLVAAALLVAGVAGAGFHWPHPLWAAAALGLTLRALGLPLPAGFSCLPGLAWLYLLRLDLGALAAAAGLLVAVDLWLGRRASFAPLLALAAGLHLCTPDPLGLHCAAVLASFVLLALAGYRHSRAQLDLLPHATYRRSPQCLVPRLEQAWDHPLRIDLV